MRPIHIAADLDLSRATVTYHLQRLHFEDPGVYEGLARSSRPSAASRPSVSRNRVRCRS